MVHRRLFWCLLCLFFVACSEGRVSPGSPFKEALEEEAQSQELNASDSCSASPHLNGYQANSLAGDADEDLVTSFYRNEASHPGASKHGSVFDFGPRQAAVLMKGVPLTSFPISSCSAEATQFFNQGIALLLAYMTLESERSFRQAWKLDPDCLMALWGMSLSQITFFSGNEARGKKFAKLAYELKEEGHFPVDALESRLIDLLYNLLAGDADNKKHDFNRELLSLAHSTQNDDLKALSVEFVWEYNSYEALGTTKEQMDQLIQEVLESHPGHPIRHQRIHMWNDQQNEHKLIEDASKIGPSMRSAGHMWHMASHVYFPLQRYADVDQQFEAAQRSDHKYLKSISEFPYVIHNYAHNANFWTHNLIGEGALKAAEKVSLDLAALPLHPLYNDPRYFSSSYKSPFMQGVYGYINALFANAYEREIVAWSNNALIDSILTYPSASQSHPLKLLSQLIISLKENGADKKLLDQQYKRLVQWPVTTDDETEVKRKRIELVDLFFDFKKQPSLSKANELNDLNIGRGYYWKMLYQLKEYRIIIDSLYRSKEADTLLGSLYLSLAYLKNRQVPLARNSFKKAQKLAMKMDRDNVYYAMGTELNEKLNQISSEHDWRAQAETSDDFVFRSMKALGPTEFPALLINEFTADSLNGEKIKLSDLKTNKKNLLFVFVLGGRCLGCNQQIHELYESRELFQDTQIVVVSNDSVADLQLYLEDFPHLIEAGFEFMSSEDEKLFKHFRVYDDFEESAFHGTFVLNRKKEILWADRSALPFMEFSWLSKELSRLRTVKQLKNKALSYKKFPKDLRSLKQN